MLVKQKLQLFAAILESSLLDRFEFNSEWNNCGTLEKGKDLNEFFRNRLLTTCSLPYISNSLLFFPGPNPLVLLASIILAGGKWHQANSVKENKHKGPIFLQFRSCLPDLLPKTHKSLTLIFLLILGGGMCHSYITHRIFIKLYTCTTRVWFSLLVLSKVTTCKVSILTFWACQCTKSNISFWSLKLFSFLVLI